LSISALSSDNALIQGVSYIIRVFSWGKYKNLNAFNKFLLALKNYIKKVPLIFDHYFQGCIFVLFAHPPGWGRIPPADATQLAVVAVDTMHIKCNNGPSFYP